MLNIYYNTTSRGPGKVYKNFTKGLDELNIKYYINNPLPQEDDDVICLHKHQILYTSLIKNSFIGPNICVLPIDDGVMMSQKYKKTIVPCQWVKDLYLKWVPNEKLCVWAVGIDTELFSDKSNQSKTNDCLIYLKRRSKSELDAVKKILKKESQSFEVIEYGKYNEEEFIETISRSRYGIILGNTESQGIAIQEMMSCNLPLLVWDISYWTDRGEIHKVEATSIPYWSDDCGLAFTDQLKLDDLFKKFIKNLENYKPRNFILNNLTLKQSAENLLNILNITNNE